MELYKPKTSILDHVIIEKRHFLQPFTLHWPPWNQKSLVAPACNILSNLNVWRISLFKNSRLFIWKNLLFSGENKNNTIMTSVMPYYFKAWWLFLVNFSYFCATFFIFYSFFYFMIYFKLCNISFFTLSIWTKSFMVNNMDCSFSPKCVHFFIFNLKI